MGLREHKYDWLNKHSIKTVKWKKIEPISKFYLFIPQDQKMQKGYQVFTKITEIFPVNNVGIVTARDSFVIDSDKKQLEKRIVQFMDSKYDEEILKQTYGLKENKNWKIEGQREKLRKDEKWRNAFTKILYRPFDLQWVFYHDEMVERSRKEVMRHMLQENIGIVTSRQTSSDFRHVFITDKIIEFNLTGTAGKYGSGYLFPLYLYPEKREKKGNSLSQMMIFEPEIKYQTREPNIRNELFENLKKNYKNDVTPEEIFYYIYAILYSETYRTKYSEFLKRDFPRIPFTKDYKLFIQLGKLGKKLTELHLLKSKNLDKTISKFPIAGNNKVRNLKYESERIWINDDQYFDGIKKEIFKYQIGGYQVTEKWLKDRKDKTLSSEEIKTFCKIVTAISKTIELQNEIDTFYSNVEETI